MKYYKLIDKNCHTCFELNCIYPESFKVYGFVSTKESASLNPEDWIEVSYQEYCFQEGINPFEVNDKVRFVSSKSRFLKGTNCVSTQWANTILTMNEIYTVKYCSNSGVDISLVGVVGYSFNASQFDLVEEDLNSNKVMEQELKITREKVLAAASKCSTAKSVLKEMFPEVFEDDKYLNLSHFPTFNVQGDTLLQVRSVGKFANKAIILSDDVKWEIKKDDVGYLCLIPTKK